MRTVLLAVVFAVVLSGLTGCDSSKNSKAGEDNQGPPPQNSGAGKEKTPRVPPPTK